MKSFHDYIVEFDSSHKTETEIAGITLDINPIFEEHKWINRIGTVVSCPMAIDSPVEVGYQVMVSHIFLMTETYGKTGRVKSVDCIDDKKNHFRITPESIFLYRESESDPWLVYGKNVFVTPVKIEQKAILGLDLPDMVFENEKGYKGNEKQVGTVSFANRYANEMGIMVGDTVLFKRDREYEFEIDGEIHYLIDNRDLLAYEVDLEKSEKHLEDAFI